MLVQDVGSSERQKMLYQNKQRQISENSNLCF
jgi:hypothetical protein